jgi:hypothetical protein
MIGFLTLAVPPPEPVPAIIEPVAAFLSKAVHLDSMNCPHCGGRFPITAMRLPQWEQRPEDRHETRHRPPASRFSNGWKNHSRNNVTPRLGKWFINGH